VTAVDGTGQNLRFAQLVHVEAHYLTSLIYLM